MIFNFHLVMLSGRPKLLLCGVDGRLLHTVAHGTLNLTDGFYITRKCEFHLTL